MLCGIKDLHIEADELAGGVFEQGPRASREILHTGADAEDGVSFSGKVVGGGGAGDTD